MESKTIIICPLCGGRKMRRLLKMLNNEVVPVDTICELCGGEGQVEQTIKIIPYKGEVKQ